MGPDFEIMFEEIYRTQFSSMLRILKRSADNPFQAEEALQNAFLLAWSAKREDFSAHPNPTAWIVKTAQYYLKNAKRSDARLAKRLVLLDENIASKVGKTDEVDLDFEYAGTLPEKDFKMLKRVYLEGYNQTEIAEEFHISPNSAYMKVKRAKDKLREQLKSIEKKFGGTCYDFPGSEHYLNKGDHRDAN